MNEIPNNELPSYVREKDPIDSIMTDVEENESSFDAAQPDKRVYYAQVSVAQDQIIIIPGPVLKRKDLASVSETSHHQPHNRKFILVWAMSVLDQAASRNTLSLHKTGPPPSTLPIKSGMKSLACLSEVTSLSMEIFSLTCL